MTCNSAIDREHVPPGSHYLIPLPTPPSFAMSLFRIGGASGLRATRLAAPVNVRFVSNGTKGTPVIKTDPSEAPTATHSSSSLIRKQGPAEAMTHHQPDYEATIDHGTSYAIPHQPPSQILSANPDDSFQDLLSGPQACDGWQ